MLRLILDHDLVRFSATVRAIDVWFGHFWAAATPSIFKKMLAQLIEFLDDPDARQKALAGKHAEAAFLALWSMATEDLLATILKPASGIRQLSHQKNPFFFGAAQFSTPNSRLNSSASVALPLARITASICRRSSPDLP